MCADFKIRHQVLGEFQKPRLEAINMDYIYVKKNITKRESIRNLY